MNTIKNYEFSEEFQRGDMTHRGPFDFYERCEAEIKAAIASGLPFDTGWRSCKHEILSSRICRDAGGAFTCEVSVSDDFDTDGTGSESFNPEPGDTAENLWEALETTMARAHEEAESDQKANQVFRGFSIHVKCRRKRQKLQRWDKSKPRKISRSNRRSAWVETYILNIGQWWGPVDDEPPGDCYHQWGFQNEDLQIPLNVREALEDYAQSYRAGMSSQFTCKRWTIKPWEIIR
jgi:hypothetical protein